MDGRLHFVIHFGIDDNNPINYDGCEARANVNHLLYDELSIELQTASSAILWVMYTIKFGCDQSCLIDSEDNFNKLGISSKYRKWGGGLPWLSYVI